ncbi:hypothetical protein FDC49_10570 [Clostridium sporogenes]|uniref:hypothetical protein n=1 Tax=Clostridium sporogenes TaxID=1509 RepID=UPI0013D471D8|nr:hypothetical protein [Clostridium sporogenes]NFG96864.1 hypothetical protein [Clostridium sporogenes]NFH33214.1 hypothetical protein [Clostridium sporogenes]NFL20201.1 hypothetical protein [Clostridium sporogenes]NFN71795.1 hypothetical protein [Clostridium sporogenes]NFV21964.1 hypothetical protein [Clostridium sporogenes]
MNLQVGDLIPLQGITKADKQKLIEIVNKAEANQSTIKTNIINVLNNKLKTKLKTDSSWIDIQNVINSTTVVNHAKGIFHGSDPYEIKINFKPNVIILKNNANGYMDKWCYPEDTFEHFNTIRIDRYDNYTRLAYRYANGGSINLDGYSWEVWE